MLSTILAFCAAISAIPLETRQLADPLSLSVNAPTSVNGRASYKLALLKFKSQPSLRQARTPSGQSTIYSVDVSDDLLYLTPVKFASQGSTLFYLDFDTGSSDTWVISTETPPSSRGTRAPYNVSKAKPVPGQTWSISYGDGSSSSGNVFNDTLILGSLSIPSQEVEAAQQVSSSFSGSALGGLLGLALPQLNSVSPNQAATPNQNLAAKKLTNGAFAADLKHDTTGASGAGGSFQFGGSFTNYGKLAYTPLDSTDGFWQVQSPMFKIGSKGTSLPRFSDVPTNLDVSQAAAIFAALSSGTIGMLIPGLTQNHQAIIDTGTTLMLIDDVTLLAIYSQIPGASYDLTQQGYVLPCTPQSGAPDGIYFQIGGVYYALPYSYAGMVYQPIGNGMCYGAIQSRGTETLDIYGDAFLKSNYVVFDQPNLRVGIAAK